MVANANQIYITFMLMVESTRASTSEEVNCHVFITYPRVTRNSDGVNYKLVALVGI